MSAAAGQTSWRTWLKLGRVSNLPTVWTNALAGATLAGVGLGGHDLALLCLSLSLFYVGGMYLNDAFDAEIDAAERSNRPIPSGEVSRGTVFALGFAMLAGGIALGFGFGPAAGLIGVALAAAVLLYDWLHKRSVTGPLIMGACRFLTYGLAGAAAVGAAVTGETLLWIGAAGLFAYVVGLTYAAKQEAYDRIGAVWPLFALAAPVLIAAHGALARPTAWLFVAALVLWMLIALRRLFRRAKGDVPRAVVGLIAGISLYDAALIAGAGAPLLALVAVAGFGATLALQRLAPGT